MAYTNYGKQARKKMIDKDMKMTELAIELNISSSYLTDIFSGARKGTQQRKKIVKILEINENEIAG